MQNRITDVLNSDHVKISEFDDQHSDNNIYI